MPYPYHELLTAYRNLGVKDGSVVYAFGIVGHLMQFENPGATEVLDAHISALREERVGRCKIYSYSLSDFYYATLRYLSEWRSKAFTVSFGFSLHFILRGRMA